MRAPSSRFMTVTEVELCGSEVLFQAIWLWEDEAVKQSGLTPASTGSQLPDSGLTCQTEPFRYR